MLSARNVQLINRLRLWLGRTVSVAAMMLAGVLFPLALAAISNPAAAKEPLDSHLEPFEPLLGKTWVGEIKGAPGTSEAVDVSRWERALNGMAIRILHSLNEGAYGGETIIFWDKEKESLVGYYFTTAGFRTVATMEHVDGEFHSHETVSGNAGGVSEVRAVSKLLEDGRLYTKSEYMMNGEWVPGMEAYYHEDPTAEVIFK